MADVIEIWGMDEVMEVLNKLPQTLKYKQVQNTYAEILKSTVVKDAKANVKVSKEEWKYSGLESRSHKPGNLRRSIGVKKGTNKKYPIVFAGPRSYVFSKTLKNKGKQLVNDGWYAHMVEYGHELTNKKRKKTGKQYKIKDIDAKPFMRPAWDKNMGKVESMIARAFGKVYTQMIKRETRRMTKSKGITGKVSITKVQLGNGQTWTPSRDMVF